MDALEEADQKWQIAEQNRGVHWLLHGYIESLSGSF